MFWPMAFMFDNYLLKFDKHKIENKQKDSLESEALKFVTPRMCITHVHYAGSAQSMDRLHYGQNFEKS